MKKAPKHHILKPIGKIIRKYMLQHGWTYRKLAEATGYSQSHCWKVGRDHRLGSLEFRDALGHAFGVCPSTFGGLHES